MARKHIEFVNIHEIEWRSIELPGFTGEISQKLLSTDTDNGASTSLIYISAGSTCERASYNASIEVLLLEGEAKIGEQILSDMTHVFIQKDVELKALTFEKACTLLWMTNGRLELADGNNSSDNQDVVIKKTSDIPWQGTITPGFPTGAMRKSLFQDQETGASSWLLGVLPQFQDERYEIHPVMEEAFQIHGEMGTSRGDFKQGSYFWRPAEIPHGDFSTEWGCLTFFRTDGPLKTTYVNKEDL